MKNDEIEEVTDEMLEMLVKSHEHVAAIICKSGEGVNLINLTMP